MYIAHFALSRTFLVERWAAAGFVCGCSPFDVLLTALVNIYTSCKQVYHCLQAGVELVSEDMMQLVVERGHQLHDHSIHRRWLRWLSWDGN